MAPIATVLKSSPVSKEFIMYLTAYVPTKKPETVFTISNTKRSKNAIGDVETTILIA